VGSSRFVELRPVALGRPHRHQQPQLVSYGFYQFDLHLGEVIATGTPSGVALGLKSWLRPGDSVEAKIDGVGTLHTVGRMRCPATPDEA
jgi:2-keto-4-pentenoate hydratase/2-oxohepta-3-ene-1,7-dioic acid hydratase in catechol pathway